MIHAYSQLYLSDARNHLANMFDYVVNDCNVAGDWFAVLFAMSDCATMFERGNPGVVSGKSGCELARDVFGSVYRSCNLPQPGFRPERTPEYWAGWALAEYQWYTGRRFADIFRRVPFSKIVNMYSLFHEMDISHFIDTMERFYGAAEADTNLKRIRESRGLSQSELAIKSGVNLRSVQMYEQRVNDIDKAQVHTIYKLSRVLNCDIEDLLENPMRYPGSDC